MSVRLLDFASLEDALAEARRLRDGGYRKLGNWDLGQILNHLSILMEQSLDGFSVKPFPWIVRATFGRFFKRRFLAGKWPKAMRTPTSFVPDAESDEATAFERFERAVQRVTTSNTFRDSPALGKLTVDEWRRLHTTHAAHHLGFLQPGSARSPLDSGIG
jgi:hypothetical protein